MIDYFIYIVDDEKSIRDGVTFGLRKQYRVKAFDSAEAALVEIDTDVPDLVLLDIGLPGMSGIEALQEIKKRNPNILVIMATAYEDIDTVLAAMKSGAHDYIVKPLHMDSLKHSITRALDTIKLRKEIQTLQEQTLKENIPCFVAESNVIQDVMQFVDKVAQSPDTPVLIIGATGTGKELIAGAVHYNSPNFRGPFVSINCAAIPKDLIESELFGYEKGAFSGALIAGKKGLVEEAAGGTLFLDEVADLSLQAQAKLLRFLEDGEYYRVGGTQKLSLTTRIVSATNKDLEQMVQKELFRQDLYYRLAVIKIEIPSLNERPEDIVPIARHFLAEFNNKHGKSFIGIAPEAESFLENHQWKGNIRELKNMIERGVLVGSGPNITLEDLGMQKVTLEHAVEQDGSTPHFPSLPNDGIDLDALEKHYIRQAYKKAGGNEKRAAELLHMSYYAFRYKRKKIKKLT